MTSDLFSLTKNEYEDVLNSPEKHFKYYDYDGRKCAKHIKRGPQSSSQKVDKKLFEELRRSFNQKRNKKSGQGNFNGSKIIDFINPHLTNKLILVIDIKSFYNSITFNLFRDCANNQYGDLKTYEKIYFKPNLIVGLSSSPVIAEIVIQKIIDSHMNNLIHDKKEKIVYTRFYDDIYISSNEEGILQSLKTEIQDKLKTNKLILNIKKSKIHKVDNSLILKTRINDEKIYVGKKYKNNLRYLIYKFESNTESLEETYKSISRLSVIMGKISYIIRTETTPAPKWSKILDSYSLEMDDLQAIKDQFLNGEI